MRDPYLYEDVDILRNLADIKDRECLRRAEADITNLAMACIYNRKYDKFNSDTLRDIHRSIFGQIYEWAGEYRIIHMRKSEEVLGGDTVRYAYPAEIKKQLNASMRELGKLKRNGSNDHDVVFRLVRLIAQIWQIHPFREGNTRSIIVFAVLFAQSLGFDVDHELFKEHANYVRNSLVWASQGIYSQYQYLEDIFFDAILHQTSSRNNSAEDAEKKYEKIGDYQVRDYREQPHEYLED